MVAAYSLATAAIDEGRYGQAFPAFGAERRGAPVMAFVRIADQPFKRHCQVLHPAFLIIQDQALLHVPGVTDGLLSGGGILVNSSLSSEELSAQTGHKLITLPASALANEYLGRPVPNTALLSAFLVLTDLMPVESLTKALAHRFKGDILERNIALIHKAAGMVPQGLWKEATHATSA